MTVNGNVPAKYPSGRALMEAINGPGDNRCLPPEHLDETGKHIPLFKRLQEPHHDDVSLVDPGLLKTG